jgi:hypothetical protein
VSDSQRRPGENEVAYKSRLARERGEAGRREALQRAQAARAPAVKRGEDIRRGPIREGEQGRAGPELRGVMRRVGALNRLTPPPQARGEAESMRKIEEMSPARKVLQWIDRARGRQPQ